MGFLIVLYYRWRTRENERRVQEEKRRIFEDEAHKIALQTANEISDPTSGACLLLQWVNAYRAAFEQAYERLCA